MENLNQKKKKIMGVFGLNLLLLKTENWKLKTL